MSQLDATNASFIMGLIVFVWSRRDKASQYDKGRNISVTCLRYSANDNALANQSTPRFSNQCVSERRSIEEQ